MNYFQLSMNGGKEMYVFLPSKKCCIGYMYLDYDRGDKVRMHLVANLCLTRFNEMCMVRHIVLIQGILMRDNS